MSEIPEKLQRYECPKCGHFRCRRGQLRGAGGFLAKLFNVENRRFTTYTCTMCGYTELFEAESSVIGNVIDFFAN